MIQRDLQNVFILSMCQGLWMTGVMIVMTVSVLAGRELAADAALASLPLTIQFVVMTAMIIPASFLMRAMSRRSGFTLGALAGAIGAAISTIAILNQSFLLFCFGAALIGVFNAFAGYYRFAAADAASGSFKSRAISLVLAGGVLAAFFGPQLAKASQVLFDPFPFAGAYAVMIGLSLLAALLILFVDIPKPASMPSDSPSRSLHMIAKQPNFVVALITGVICYAVMTLVMSATPLAMADSHHLFADAVFVIEWHAFGMFAPSFITGYLITRIGVLETIVGGSLIMLSGIGVNLTGTSVSHFWIGLVFIGIGWNFMFIGATNLLTETYKPSEMAKVQACNDFIIFAAVAVAAMLAGWLQHVFRWEIVNLGVLPAVLLALAAACWLLWRGKREGSPLKNHPS